MLLHKTHDNPAVMGNVTAVGEFRIRNSAKAFNILSSGLYANKIRAIIRELSCNAVDSHTAAGNAGQFEIHLPTMFEPYFAVRDWGTGLTHDQVVNIYTTYFESTKTASNEFIGALGLGSKSPFSYTDNFTVTAVRDGRQGVYSAYINDDGIPSIVLMSETATTEPNGVEVRFGVSDQSDFYKFRSEAESVFQWFANPPRITGAKIDVAYYRDKMQFVDIVPGIHATNHSHYSYAIMGNIGYRIEISNAGSVLGRRLADMLDCGLYMEFPIGALDFQASREGLSYIPQTIEAIKTRLQELEAALHTRMSQDLDAIANDWERTYEFDTRYQSGLFRAVAESYLAAHSQKILGRGGGNPLELTKEKLAEFNIDMGMFERRYNGKIRSARTDWSDRKEIRFVVSTATRFIVNDTERGLPLSVLNYQTGVPNSLLGDAGRIDDIYVVNRLDCKKPAQVADFFASLKEPPVGQRIDRGVLAVPPRTATTKVKGKILKLIATPYRGSRDEAFYWEYANTLDNFSTTDKIYYLPLRNRTVADKPDWGSGSEIWSEALRSGLFKNITLLHGVTATVIDDVKELPNWVNFEDHMKNTLSNLDPALRQALMATKIGSDVPLRHTRALALLPGDHPLSMIASSRTKASTFDYQTVVNLQNKILGKSDLETETVQEVRRIHSVINQYPLLKYLNHGGENDLTAIVEYVKLLDEKRKNTNQE